MQQTYSSFLFSVAGSFISRSRCIIYFVFNQCQDMRASECNFHRIKTAIYDMKAEMPHTIEPSINSLAVCLFVLKDAHKTRIYIPAPMISPPAPKATQKRMHGPVILHPWPLALTLMILFTAMSNMTDIKYMV